MTVDNIGEWVSASICLNAMSLAMPMPEHLILIVFVSPLPRSHCPCAKGDLF